MRGRRGGLGGGRETDSVVSKVESAFIVSMALLNLDINGYLHSVSEEVECISD